MNWESATIDNQMDLRGISATALTDPLRLLQGEIVNILLKIKNSFLPTKQILIGL